MTQSLHPPILYGLFKDWDGKMAYDPALLPTLIYADMRTGSAKALVQMDQVIACIVRGHSLGCHPSPSGTTSPVCSP